MSGAGRKSQNRKGVVDAVLNDHPEPAEGEQICKVVATRGGNQFDIVTPGSEHPQLALLPSKFHKVVWIKRNDYVIVRGVKEDDEKVEAGDGDAGDGDADDKGGSGIRFMIEHILYKTQIKHLKSKDLWPTEFGAGHEDDPNDDDSDVAVASTDGIAQDQGLDDNDDDIFENTNRMARIQISNDEDDDDSLTDPDE
mmetsp:Transcript_5933/g.8427  ORF Transcript_5933/g.8427 Transcript_5933/m.8427 type:complete len:196 (-) Transcript_5933:307-894(-)|eukprot:CAMPEP_0194034736 /NCGR_PEP_ID=MMETSP0009_2-20130614/7157_1 /TAXON_ID=210454 /ORGANISM="Grammatophora oceanica, Strain CCMP 410" /LENGTH=195 /DNA_ID=CAMNT_0038675781 /DNA_START=103 /DNA_END=690 /DNA_ORIENTATION=+